MIRIAQIGFSYKVGGIEKYVINTLQYLPKDKYEIIFINVCNGVDNEFFIEDIKSKRILILWKILWIDSMKSQIGN